MREFPVILGKADVEGVSGQIVLSDGQKIKFVRLGYVKETKPQEYYVSGNIGGQSVSYPLSKLRSVLFPNHESGSMDEVIVVGKTGESFTLTGTSIGVIGDRTYDGFSYVYHDKVTGELMESYAGVRSTKLVQIVIEGDAGTLRRNPRTKDFYPATYNFDPFTGEELVWALPGQPTAVSMPPHGRLSGRALEAVLNASLSRHGVDPLSEEAKRARDFAELWMNPRADLPEIQKKLEEMRKDFLKNDESQ